MEMNNHDQRLDVLFAGMVKNELLELADDIISDMEAKAFRERIAEEKKENPDQELIARLKIGEKELREERRKILSSDEETQRNCVRKYSPILRAMVSKSE